MYNVAVDVLLRNFLVKVHINSFLKNVNKLLLLVVKMMFCLIIFYSLFVVNFVIMTNVVQLILFCPAAQRNEIH